MVFSRVGAGDAELQRRRIANLRDVEGGGDDGTAAGRESKESEQE